MNAFRMLAVSFAVIAGASLLHCKKQIVSSNRAETPPVIDGLSDEWQSGVMLNEKWQVAYALSNDDRYLYLMLSSDHPGSQSRLLMSGLVVWLDTQGDGKKDIGFKYPIGIFERGLNPGEVMRSLMGRNGWDEAGFRSYVKNWCSDIQLIDDKNKNLGMLNHRDAQACDIHFQLALHENKLVYELAVPLDGTPKHPWNLRGTNFRLGFEAPKFEFSGMRRPMGGFAPGGAESGGGSPVGGGRGGRGGGGGGGAMPMPDGGGMPQAPARGMFNSDPINLWMTVSLAK